MTDQQFQDRVLVWIERTEGWKDRTDNRLDNLEGRMDNLEGQMTNLQERIGSLQEGIAWILGKLEGKQESDAVSWSKLAVLIAAWSIIISILAYFK